MSENRKKGFFLTLEGVDGAGKSTHIPWIKQQLEQLGIGIVVTREPGGTALGEKLRELLLNEKMHLKTESLLMFAARNEHVETVIQPALNASTWVLCDRFTDASFAYQGGGRQLGARAIEQLEQWVHPDLQPTHTWLFDLDLAIAQQRLQATRVKDRFEQEELDFFVRTQQFYQLRAQQQPHRFSVIDSSQPIETIRQQLLAQLTTLVKQWQTL